MGSFIIFTINLVTLGQRWMEMARSSNSSFFRSYTEHLLTERKRERKEIKKIRRRAKRR
jgi:hypothetical protein